MLDVSIVDINRNEKFLPRTREATDIERIKLQASTLKWKEASHISRWSNSRCSRQELEWWPRLGKRRMGHPAAGGIDDLNKMPGSEPMRIAQDQDSRLSLRQAFVQ